MDRNTIQKILIGLFFQLVFLLVLKHLMLLDLMKTATKPEVNANVSSSRMTYGRFLEYLEMGWVKQVDLYDNSRNAIVQASSPELGNRPQSIRVEIPVGASQLIQKLKEYNIDFDAHPAPQKKYFYYNC
jgi:ATP-dependent Zn protease